MPTSSARETVRELLAGAVQDLTRQGFLAAGAGEIPVSIERTKRPEHGDFASNVALTLAKPAGKPPRAVAEAIVARLTAQPGSPITEANIAGPGFINVRLAPAFWQAALGQMLSAGNDWGRAPAQSSPRILLEYLSSNPTGPVTVAHGRVAAVGDALARLMRFAGYDLTTEFYVNDAGNQVQTLALSTWVRYMETARAVDPTVPEAAFPENGYKGGYIRDFGRALYERDGARWIGPTPPADMEPIQSFAIESSLRLIRGTLERFAVTFDVWQSERELHKSGDVASTLEALETAGFIDRHDGAVWLRTTALWGDDKDRVVMKSDGLPTYLLADIAYHRKKLARGYTELCDIWGADHHGYIPRMQAALKAFGYDPAVLRVILIQIVSLLRNGQPVAMGKREGEFVTLDEVISEVGRDATRFFYLMRRHDTSLEFDLDLAKKQSLDNPVYYVQYGHARCAAILRRAAELGAERPAFSPELARELALPEEIAILRRLADFPDFIADAAAAREPQRLTTYLMELAGEFQSYYTQLQKVHGDTILPQERHRVGDWRATWNWRKTAARLWWVEAIAQVMRNGLALLGVSAPESMARGENTTKEDES
ncbi:MAG TPA: arginine--tRNA ligase [Polyangia bacterium]|nr:arginine--tRNA ligase [Polyangia bacterium]